MPDLTTIITFAVLATIVLAILLLSDRSKVRNAAPEDRDREARRVRRETKSTLIGLVFVIGLTILLTTGVVPQIQPVAVLRGVLATGFGLLMLYVIWSRIKYRKTIRALRLAHAGDLDGAVALIRKALEEKPDSSELWNTLGVLLEQQEKYAEALEAIERAEQFGLHESIAATNKALMLRKLGRLEESLAIVTVEVERNPKNLLAAINLAHLLHDLERFTEAGEQLAVVERIDESQQVPSEDERKIRQELIKELRTKIRGD